MTTQTVILHGGTTVLSGDKAASVTAAFNAAEAKDARDEAVLLSSSAGAARDAAFLALGGKAYATYADGLSAIGDIPSGAIVQIIEDEDYGGQATYRQSNGTDLVYLTNLRSVSGVGPFLSVAVGGAIGDAADADTTFGITTRAGVRLFCGTNGGAANNAIGWVDDLDTGFSRPFSDNIYVNAGGVSAMKVYPTRVTFFDTSNQFGNLASGTATNDAAMMASGGSIVSQRSDNASLVASKSSTLHAAAISGATATQIIAANTLIQFTFGAASVGRISLDGAGGVNYTSFSDYRLKDDLQPFSGLDYILKMSIWDYRHAVTGERAQGWMAHELQSVIPYAVQGEKDATDESGPVYQSVDYAKITPHNSRAIQELYAEIQLIKAAVAALSAKDK